MCWRIWRNIFINWKIVTLKKKKIVIVTTFCQKYHKVQEVSFHLCPHGLNLFEDRQHRDMNFALDKNLLCSRKIASFWITSFPLINPIRPGHLGCIKSRRGGGGVQKTTLLKALFWLSKCFEIWFEEYLGYFLLFKSAVTHTVHKYA